MASRLASSSSGGGGGSATTDASLLTSGTLPLGRLSGITTSQLSATAGITSGQISSVDAATVTTGTLPLGRLSGITTTQLSASAGITSGQIASVDAATITSGTLPLGRLSGITTSQLDAAAGITSGQIASLAAAKLTGTNTLPDGVLSTNVPLLGAANTFSAAQTISGTVNGVLAQLTNASTTGAGLVIGSTTVASAGAGLSAPALACTQAPPATSRYGLLSLGSGPWDGTTTGFFSGSSSGTALAVNAASVFGGNLLDLQVAGSSKFSVNANSIVSVGASSYLSVPQIRPTGTTLTLATATVLGGAGPVWSFTQLGGATLNGSSGTQVWTALTPTVNASGTAGYTALQVNVSETATGSGTKRLLDLQVGGTSKASIDNSGALAFSPATTTSAPGAGAAGALPATPALYFTVTLGGTAYKVAAY